MRVLWFLVAVVLLAATPAQAALQVEAFLDPEQCRVGEQVVLTVTVTGGMRSVPDAKLPDLSQAFDLYDGGTSRNFSMSNGTVSSSVSRRYVLVPKRAGSFIIDPITVTHNQESAQTQPLTLEVLASNAPRVEAPDDAEGTTTGTDDLFVRASVDVSDPYVSQQVTYRVRLYTALTLLESPGFTPPSTEGFWKEALPPQSPRVETVNGRRYQVLEVAIAVFPTAPGNLVLGESTLQCVVEKRNSRRSNDPFRSVFDRFEGTRVTLRTDPLTLKVRPLPAGAPPGFAGAVGDFKLSASLDRTEATQGDPVNLTLVVQGTGNLRGLGEIRLPEMPDFRSYPSTAETEPKPAGTKLGGTVKQQFVLVPLTAGRRVIPPVEIPVFSPSKGQYEVLRTEPLAVLVAAGSGGSDAALRGASRGDIELMGRDIRFIETGIPEFAPRGSAGGRVELWLSLLPLPALCWAGVWGWDRRRRRLDADTAGTRRRKAAKNAIRRLSGGSGARGDDAARAAAAVRAYLADRWNVAAQGLTVDRIRELLSESPHADALIAFLDRCDAARYAPEGAVQGSDRWRDEAVAWIDRLEGEA